MGKVSVDQIEFIVEEPSTEEMLRILLPRILGSSVAFNIYSMGSKSQLLKRLPNRLRGYKHWISDNCRIIIVVDRDDEDCRALKSRLAEEAANAGLAVGGIGCGKPWQVANRIVVEELEAWFFGDTDALRMAYPRVPESLASQRKYRDPDAIRGGTWEALEQVLQRAGYYKTGLPKIEAARNIAKHMDPCKNRSRSFRIFRNLLLELADS
jgi:hypothetical protein